MRYNKHIFHQNLQTPVLVVLFLFMAVWGYGHSHQGCTDVSHAPMVSQDMPISDSLRLFDPVTGCWHDTASTIVLKTLIEVTLDPCGGTCDVTTLVTGMRFPDATPCPYAESQGYEFAGWTTEPVNDTTSIAPTPLYQQGETFQSSMSDTLYAVYMKCTQTKFNKVTATPNSSNWNGRYLIVSTNDSKAFDGSLQQLDVSDNYISVSINNSIISGNHQNSTFTIAPHPDDNTKYTIKSHSGYYIGRNGTNNGLDASTDNPYKNDISISNGDIDISGAGGSHLRFYNQTNPHFRYCNPSTFQNHWVPIQLYRYNPGGCEYTSFPPLPHSDTTVIACQSYYWHEVSYIQTGEYTQGNGCDSVVTLHLTVLDENPASVYFNPGNGTCDTTPNPLTEEDCLSGITLPSATPCDSVFEFVGWAIDSIADSTNTVPTPLYPDGALFNPSTDTTLYAVYKRKSCTLKTVFTKVTRDTTDWSGEYLIAYTNLQGTTKVFDGNLHPDDLNANTNCVNSPISTNGNHNDTIKLENNLGINASTFLISRLGGEYYSIKTKSGWYIGGIAGSQEIATDPNAPFPNTIALNANEEVSISSNGEELRTINGNKFSYYNFSKKPKLYRREIVGDCMFWTWVPLPGRDTTAVACESFLWRGMTCDTSGTYYDTLRVEGGCDSVVTLNLTVKHSSHNAETLEACDSLTWNGTLYTASGDYTYEYTNAEGCPSADTLHLTVKHSSHNAETLEACDSLTWNGTLYTASGDYTYEYTNAEGCPSADTLHLTVKHSSHNAETLEACDSLRWNGTLYTASGDYTHEYTNAEGCPSADTLHLTVHPSYSISLNPTICEGSSYTLLDTILTTTGTYTRTGTTMDGGCDSTVTINLTVSSEYRDTISGHICLGESYMFDEVPRTENGFYTQIDTAQNGCDSIIVLHLFVHELDTTHFENTICLGTRYQEYGFDTLLTTSGTHTLSRTIPTPQYHCDSTIIVTLTVRDSVSIVTSTLLSVCPNAGEVTVSAQFQNAADVNTNVTWTVNGSSVSHNTVNSSNSTDSYTIQIPSNLCNDSLYYIVEYTDGICSATTTDFIQVIDTLNPVVNGTLDSITITGCSIEDIPEAYSTAAEINALENVSIEDNCTSLDNLTLTHSDNITDDLCNISGIRTYTIADACGNDTVITQYFLIQLPDTIPNVPANDSLEVSCLVDAINPGAPEITDLCGHTITPVFVDSTTTLSPNGTENVVFRYRYTDCAGHDSIYTYIYTIIPDVSTFPEDRYDTVFSFDGVIFSEPLDISSCGNIISPNFSHYTSDFTYVSLDTAHILIYGDTLLEDNDTTYIYFYIYGDNNHSPGDTTYEVHHDTTYVSVYGTYFNSNTIFVYGDTAIVYSYSHNGRNSRSSEDSLWTHNFYVIPEINDTEELTACDSLIWKDGMTYYEGTTIPTVNGTIEVDGMAFNLTVTLNLTINSGTHNVETVTECESYEWHERNYTSSGTFIYEYGDECESTDTLHLTINQPFETTIHITINQNDLPYTLNGIDYDTAGTYVQDTTDVFGCDSTITLVLNVNSNVSNTIDSTVCENDLPIFWNDFHWYGSGINIITFQGAAASGADSTLTMVLTVNDAYEVTDEKTVCSTALPYTWNGVEFAGDGTQTVTLTADNQCDSIVTMTLTVNDAYEVTDEKTVCNTALPYTWNGVEFTGDGTQTVTLTADNQCDSIVTMTLTILQSSTSFDPRIACDSLVWHDSTYRVSTIDTFRTTNNAGCDSLVILQLTINNATTSEQTLTECDSIVWDGTTYYANTTLSDTLTSTLTGCDSIIITNLIVNYPQPQTLNTQDCKAYTWSWPDGGDTTITTSGTYLHSHADNNGCDQVDTLYFTFLDPATNIISMTHDFCDDRQAVLTVESALENYVWSTGETSPTITVFEEGLYTVTATQGECEQEASFTVEPCEYDILLPNAISANSTVEENHFFRIQESQLEFIDDNHFSIYIYNRWGELAFSSTSKYFQWDGKINDQTFYDEIYNYVIYFRTKSGKSRKLTGSVLVL